MKAATENEMLIESFVGSDESGANLNIHTLHFKLFRIQISRTHHTHSKEIHVPM